MIAFLAITVVIELTMYDKVESLAMFLEEWKLELRGGIFCLVCNLHLSLYLRLYLYFLWVFVL